jgi:ubiquinone/menaquinone biosynthesis C-methylase UbiE
MSENYVLGQSTHEYERLTLQARLLRPFTERLFRTAGVSPGMRVLDVGSGMGDVALLLADIVGPDGKVVGVDRDAAALERARQRTVDQGCSSWVEFQATMLEDFDAPPIFDAVVGRYILLYQSDAAATIRGLLQLLKPGGIVAFHELDFTDVRASDPPSAIWDAAYALVSEAFRRSGAPPDFGRRIGPAFVGAGLPFPNFIVENLIGGARGSYVYPWVANTLISVAPSLPALGLTMPTGLRADDTLAQKLEDAVVASGSQILAPTQYGAWTRKSV